MTDPGYVTLDTGWFTPVESGKFFTGINFFSDGCLRWAPADPPVEMEPGISYRINVKDGKARVTRVGHRFDV